MEKNIENKKSIQDKLATIKYNCSNKAHLVADLKKCAKCKEKTCTHICPADVYEWDKNLDEIVVRYENCLECGACRISCPKGAISWEYPEAGCGVILKNN